MLDRAVASESPPHPSAAEKPKKKVLTRVAGTVVVYSASIYSSTAVRDALPPVCSYRIANKNVLSARQHVLRTLLGLLTRRIVHYCCRYSAVRTLGLLQRYEQRVVPRTRSRAKRSLLAADDVAQSASGIAGYEQEQ